MKSSKLSPHFCGVDPADTIGGRLRELRNHHGMTRTAFAEKTGLSPGQVARFENAGQQATRSDQPSCDQIARAFGVQPAWLYAGTAVPKRLWPEWWMPPSQRQ